MSVEVKGADQLAALAKALKEAGDKGLQRELTRAINDAVKPLKTKLPESARTHLPRRGGLAERVAASKIGVSRRNSSRASGLRVQAKNSYSLALMDKGFVRHPVFKRKSEMGRAAVWVTQKIEPGWFTEPTEAAAPEIRRQVEQAMQVVAAKIGRAL